MKKHFLLLLLVLGYTFGNGQSTDWKQIDSPHKNNIKLLYLASDGTMFGHATEIDKLALSLDNGENWSLIATNETSLYSSDLNIHFFEDGDNLIYFFGKNNIYTFDKINLKFDVFISTTSSNIIDVALLNNNDILVGTSGNLFLYSKTGILKNTQIWLKNSFRFLVAPNETGKNFISVGGGAIDELWEFTSDLSFVGNKKSIGSFIIVRHEDRLISENKYSDDGGATWKQINGLTGESIYFVYKGNDDKIFFVTWDGFFMSDNNFSNLNFTNLEFDQIDYMTSINNTVILDAYIERYCNPQIFILIDGNDITKINNDIKDNNVELVYPGIDENIFALDCIIRLKGTDSTSWKEVINSDQFGLYYHSDRIFNLSNDEVLATFYSDQIYKSLDRGNSWTPINTFINFSIFDQFVIEKKGVIYNLNYDSLMISKDFGKTWLNKSISEDIYFRLFDKVDYSQYEEIYFYDDFNFRTMFKYDVTTQIATPTNYKENENGTIIDFATSFDGNRLYIISMNWVNNNLNFYVSFDGGQTFQTYDIGIENHNYQYRLKTDHLGNIYVYSESIVLMSSDQGASWQNLTPDFPELISINNLQVSYDNYIYLATNGKGILKYNVQLSEPKILTVSLFDDVNKNCQQDANEGPLHHGKIVVNNNYVKAADANGEATFYVHKDQNTVTVQFNDKIYEYCQASYNVDMSSGTNSIAIPLKTKKYCADLVTSISTPFLRRCFDNTYYGQVCNDGNIDAEETEVKIILDDYFDLIQTSLPQISHVGNELILDAGTIKPGACKNINFTINLSCDAALGQEHCIIIDSESRSQSCNTIETRTEYTECQENIGSFDPNDKAIFVNGLRNQAYLEPGDKLEYMIRFQNTGTDTAFTVKIQDPISTKFDVASMRPVAASHNYVWSIDNGTLNVVFNQIMLVDSFKNEPASHGFIKFEITLDKKTMLNEEVSNVAGIYFDFNEPIITNEVVTPVGKPVFTNDWSVSPFFIFPNPSTDFISLGINDTKFNTGKVNIFDQKGGKLLTTDFNIGISNRINVSHLPSGFYIIQVVNNNSEFKTKFVKM